MTTRLSKELKNIIDRALINEVATSISLFVGFDDRDSIDDIVLVSEKSAVNSPTIYDLASLTKICGTTVAVAQAIVDGKIGLDERPFLWPISIRSILAHTSGLPAHKKFYEDLKLSTKDFARNRELIKKELFKVKPEGPNVRIYSDLGFIALGFLLEERLKKPLPEIFVDVQRSFPKANLFSIPSTTPLYNCELNIAKTGYCRARDNHIFGQVHDPNCFFMGGYGAHAGLFGTLEDVKLVGQFFLSAIKRPDSLLKATLAQFAQKGLGFDLRSPSGTQRPLSIKAFGHFGYTGTSLWIDPDHSRGLIVALLTNRVHKSSEPQGIFDLRLKVNQAIKKHAY